MRRHKATDTLRKWRLVASTHRLEDLLRERSDQVEAPLSTACVGFLLVVAALVLFSGATYSVLWPLWRRTFAPGREIGGGEGAFYYVQAAAAWLPVTFLFVFLHWFSNKLFKHNT